MLYGVTWGEYGSRNGPNWGMRFLPCRILESPLVGQYNTSKTLPGLLDIIHFPLMIVLSVQPMHEYSFGHLR